MDNSQYQVLAIKTRPQNFDQVIGQNPTVMALSHALDKNKLHHAYLFTGTRGVGKTTIARIFAKALSCETGITSNPCNKCSNCEAIASNKFPDLIEIDAASKTKVEDTRALLDTVIYSPTQGRYKIYLIDEVHMLSTHSFNALLKTLEEPPNHVKFLLATTDPHKVPATILSRCLQFNLRWVDNNVIVEHLANILQAENIKYEELALDILADSANGSVRDSLSLLEQAISIGGGEVVTEHVRVMLGRTAVSEIADLLEYIINKDSDSLINKINILSKTGLDYTEFLSQFIYFLHKLAIYQVSCNSKYNKAQDQTSVDILGSESESKQYIKNLANKISSEDLQIYYQIALLAKRDLAYSPQPKLAVEMALIRMLKFVPAINNHQTKQVSEQVSELNNLSARTQVQSTRPINKTNHKPKGHDVKTQNVNAANATKLGSSYNEQNWLELVERLDLKAISLQIIRNCSFDSFNNNKLILNLGPSFRSLINTQRHKEIEQKLQELLGSSLELTININHLPDLSGDLSATTASSDDSNNVTKTINRTVAQLDSLNKEKKHADLVEKLQKDHNINNIIETFNGELSIDSIELTD